MAYVFTPETVDPVFAGRAIEHFWTTRGPLLREKRPTDRHELAAERHSPRSSYELLDPSVDVDALRVKTWRQIADATSLDSFDEFCKWEIGRVVDPDELADPATALRYTEREAFPVGRAYDILYDYLELIGPRARVPGREVLLGGGASMFWDEVISSARDPRPLEERGGPCRLGWVIAHDGPMPGSDYLGIEVSGPIGLSCLQHVLDRAGAGIRLFERAPEEEVDPFGE